MLGKKQKKKKKASIKCVALDNLLKLITQQCFNHQTLQFHRELLLVLRRQHITLYNKICSMDF